MRKRTIQRSFIQIEQALVVNILWSSLCDILSWWVLMIWRKSQSQIEYIENHQWLLFSVSEWIDGKRVDQLTQLFQDSHSMMQVFHSEYYASCCMECMLSQSQVRIAFVFLDSILSLRNCWRLNHSLGAYFGSGEEIMIWSGLIVCCV